ncbi:hypothetical protein ACTMTI_05520 [Nonomuraea sp. H19]|uniref:hypothetical protein n=1 Tax=Nonomuraea sp. H19 TaxID=3452206 RepID=UPI003F8A5C69
MDKDHPVVLVLRVGGSNPVLARLEINNESVVRLQLSTGNGGAEEHDRLPCRSTFNFTAAEMEVLNRLSDFMAAQESSMVAGLKVAGEEVSFANPISQFGTHGVCDDDPWIIPVNFEDTGGGDFGDLSDCLVNDNGRCASRTSMHPNAKGLAAYTQVLQNHLADPAVNYTGW